MIPALTNWQWWLRWEETRIITDEGIYADSFVPEDYGGPQLTVKVIQQAIFCTSAGHFQKMTFGSTVGLKDNLRKTGLGIYINAFFGAGIEIGEEVVYGPGPSVEFCIWEVAENPALSTDLKTTLYKMYPVAYANL